MTHPSGYMTYIMIGKLFTYIPLGNIAYRVNLMSAFFGALAVTQAYLIVRISGGIPIAGVSASMMLGLIPLFWRNALVAESYAPAAGMITTVWLLFLVWRKTGQWQYLFLSGLAGGLSVGIHSTVVMTAASVLVVLLLTARKRMEWMGAGAGALLGLLITLLFFLFLDYHNPPSSIYNTTYFPTHSTAGVLTNDFDTPLKRFLTIFPAGRFWSYYFTAGATETGRRLVEYISFHPIWALVLILIGAFASFKQDWRAALYPIIAFLIIWSFALTVSFSIYQEFYTPIAVFVLVWYGIGASRIFEVVRQFISQSQIAVKGAQLMMGAVLILLPLWQFRADLSTGVQFGYTTFVRRDHLYPVFAPDKAIRDALKIVDQVEENAIVFTDWDKLYSYVYTAHIEEGRTGIAFHLALFDDEVQLSESTLAYIDDHIDTRPVYFAVFLPELTEHFQVNQIHESLYRVYRK
jgi:4-amino-4-deoxy-L-arabinose transferase-like glycosyltransferase